MFALLYLSSELLTSLLMSIANAPAAPYRASSFSAMARTALVPVCRNRLHAELPDHTATHLLEIPGLGVSALND